MKKVLIPTKLDPIAKSMLEQHGGYVVYQDEDSSPATLASDHQDTYAMIVRSEKITPEVIDAFPDLKVIIRAGAGYNTIDINYARSKGIDVMNTPGANSNAVAEEVVALMLADARHIIPADASCRTGKWEKKHFMGTELTGKTMGILGLGYIGRLLVKRLQGFDMRVLGYDPVVSEERAREMGVELVGMRELFSSCDYISLHIPENDATRGMINHTYFDLMKDGASLINCARSGVINEEELREAKKTKNIRFLNDVYPKDEAGDKTVTDIADIMLPHLGASTKEANRNAAQFAARQLIEFDEKGITSYIVNRDIPEGLDEAYADLAYTLTLLARSILGKKARLKALETSVYGNLSPYGDWLIVPMVCALHSEFDRSQDHHAAADFLKENGVDYLNRVVDDNKPYNNSITVDLEGHIEADTYRTISVRGTVIEGHLQISRINDFDQLYFNPQGDTVIFIYKDRPGVLSTITASLAEAKINIDDVRNPHDSKGEHSIAIIKVNQSVPQSVIDDIATKIDASHACGICL